MKRSMLFIPAIALSFLLGCGDSTTEQSLPSGTDAECGNNVCDESESCDSCEEDCGSCVFGISGVTAENAVSAETESGIAGTVGAVSGIDIASFGRCSAGTEISVFAGSA